MSRQNRQMLSADVGLEDKMNSTGMAVALFLMFMFLAAVTTVTTYAMVYGVIWYIGSSFEIPDRYSWVPLAGTCIVFLMGLVTTIRNRMPDITSLKWDSGTTDDCPSKVYIPRKGGRLWNMNPLGPQSVLSIGAIGGAILCAGPSFAITAFSTAIAHLRLDARKQQRGRSSAESKKN
jgi:hypothetical protein